MPRANNWALKRFSSPAASQEKTRNPRPTDVFLGECAAKSSCLPEKELVETRRLSDHEIRLKPGGANFSVTWIYKKRGGLGWANDDQVRLRKRNMETGCVPSY